MKLNENSFPRAIAALLAIGASLTLIGGYTPGMPFRLSSQMMWGALLLTMFVMAAIAAYGLYHTIADWRSTVRDTSTRRYLFYTASMAIALMLVPIQGAVYNRVRSEADTSFVFKDGVLRIDGSIPDSLGQRVLDLPSDSRIERLQLGRNNGGYVRAALAAGTELRRRGVDTAVIDGRCASSCAYLAMLFPRRLMAPGGSMGFHDIRSITNKDRDAVGDERSDLVSALTRAGHPLPVVMAALSSDEVQFHPLPKLIADGVITGCVAADGLTSEPCDGR